MSDGSQHGFSCETEWGDAEDLDCRGFCRDCGREHRLSAAPALPAAGLLMRELVRHGNIGLEQGRDPRLDLGCLDGPAGGQMFGVLVYRDRGGNRGVLKAFSGQYNGIWNVPGWAPPIVDPEEFASVVRDDETRIKELTRGMKSLSAGDPVRMELAARRKSISRELMARIFTLYRPANFRGQRRRLEEIFIGRGMPTGTGECCAPKLLHHAACLGLRPLGLAEFYLGRRNRSGTRRSGRFYAPCAGKCRPILGFFLCGLEETACPMPGEAIRP